MESQQHKKRILFVDDEPHLLAGLRRTLRGQRDVWEMSFVESGEQALQVVDEQEIDAVVSDMWMPGMDGAHLLKEIAERQPSTIRIVLSGHSDEKSILSLVGTAHRFLAKPCDVDVLKAVLLRSFSLQSLLSDKALKQLVSSIGSLPSIPAVYVQLIEKMNSQNATVREIGYLIGEDPPMTAKLLQLVNSAFFGVGRRITNPEDAASLLGTDTLKELVLTAGVFRQFENGSSPEGVGSLERLWHHSLVVGRLAREIAQAEGCDKEVVDDALAAGLLHDIGLLLLIFCLPDVWNKVKSTAESDGIPHWEAEYRLTGSSHTAIGAYLLGLWGLPETVVEAVAFHHRPMEAPVLEFGALAVAHLADSLFHDDGRIDKEYVAALGIGKKLEEWRELVEKVTAEAEL